MPDSPADPLPTASEQPTLPPPVPDAEAVTLAPSGEPAPAVSVVPQPPGYEILSELGRGGMGVVYKARQRSLGRTVALKMVLVGGHAGPEELARFRTEAEAIARLQHPNIVQIYEVNEHEGLPFLSLEFCPGGSLEKELAGTPLPPREAVALAERLARAVAAAHAKGVVHRDLKPANVLLAENGVPKITDFGLAKRLDAAGQTATGVAMGTPSYMAPEQAEGKKTVGPAADVYALGAMLYEFLTGRPPFRAATNFDTLLQVVGDEPVPVRQLQPKVPRDLETVCHKCLQKEPARRYAGAAALAEDLHRFRAGEPIRARPVGATERAWRWGKRNPALAALAAVLTAGVIVSTWLAFSARREAARADTKAEEAEREAQAAREARADAERKAQAARRGTYNANMLLTQLAWEQHQVDRFVQLLEEQPEDLRGFEWYYWHRKFHQGHITLRGHTLPVLSVAFSPDGRRLASAGGFGAEPGQVKLWDAQTGQEIRTLTGHTGEVTSVAFSPDGRRLASAGGESKPFSADGKRPGPGDWTVKVWDLQTGKAILTLKGHAEGITSVAFSPDGKRLASAAGGRFGGEPGEVKVWDAQTGQEALTVKGLAHGVTRVVFSPDGRRFASGSAIGVLGKPYEVKVWDTQTGKEILTLKGHSGAIQCVAFSPDGRRLATASHDRTVKVWDAQTGQEERTLQGHTGDVRSVSFSPDGRRLASASYDRTVRVWDAQTGQEIHTLKGHTDRVHEVSFSPEGRLASASGDGTVKVWDTLTGQLPLTLRGHTALVNSVIFSPEGRHLASASWDKTVKVWDAQTGHLARTLEVPRGIVWGVAFSPDGRLLAGASNGVQVWDVQTGRKVHTLTGHAGRVRGVAYSPDGRWIASAGMDDRDQAVRVWDAQTGKEIRTLKGHTRTVSGVSFSPDGRCVATASQDGTVRLWDAQSGQGTLLLRGHSRWEVNSISFSPDGRRLAGAGDNRPPPMLMQTRPDARRFINASPDWPVKVWDVQTAGEPLSLRGHTDRVNSVAFSPDGRRLASASEDGTVKLWDALTGQEVLTLKGHPSAVECVAFSPDGRRLASASGHEVKIWDASSVPEALP
jgi:WD40 repeat protein